jgi:hypothetical protein
MLTSPTHLKNMLVELDNDLSGLPGRRVSLLGFRDPNVKRVDDNVRTLRETPGWTLVDLRNPEAAQLPETLIQALTAAKLALLVDVSDALPTDASLLIRALHDSQDRVFWANGTQSQLPANRILHVIAEGARSSDELPTLLQRIDFMTFIRPPE